jgi:hypothetical protein
MFSVDPWPLSIVFVVDQSVTSDVMSKVNESLTAIQGALTPYDEVAVYSYNNGSQDRSHGFTGAQSARLPYILSMTKNTGRDMQAAPFARTAPALTPTFSLVSLPARATG